MKRWLAGSCAVLVGAVLSAQSVTVDDAACRKLSALTLPHTTITAADVVQAGGYCRVAATLKPSSDSDVKMEVWMPLKGWNGKFQAVGNQAFGGSINTGAMSTALAAGYATGSTDTGHVGGGAAWGLGHPEKVVDFGWRAVHEMTVASKQIIAREYNRAPAFSYWNGCSAAGRQGMVAAQRFPDDFNGIVAGSPGLDWTSRATQAVRIVKAVQENESARLLAPQRQLLHRAVVAACDEIDGVKDSLIDSPDRCTFDPAVLECKAGNAGSCLTPAQVETARLMYSSPANPKTKRTITGVARGSELGWTDMGWTDAARSTGLDQFRFLVAGDPAWTEQKFNFDTDVVRAEEADAGTLNALNPNLKPYFDRGGKLISYHGWSDPQISPFNTTQYYSRVVEAVGDASRVRNSYRLFMAPGMAHCGGGEGPNTFDAMAALEQWVEHGKAPDQIVASHSTGGAVDRTRPLCPYPQVATYSGKGSIDDAASFTCGQQ